MSKFIKILFLFLFISNTNLFSQENEFFIYFKNPSFEGEPRPSTTPPDWLSCGAATESDPDTQPGYFKVDKKAQDGKTYIGMVVRDNGTREAIGQRLNKPLQKDSTYNFSCWLARSPIYLSRSSSTEREVNYDTPCALRVYLGDKYCKRVEYIGGIKKVTNEEWTELSFQFTPKKDFEFFSIEADYYDINKNPYSGNVLIDNISLYKVKK